MGHSGHHYLLHHLQSNRRSRKTIDYLAYFVAVVGNAAVIPQGLEAWRSSAPGMSIATWALFLILAVIWLLYAIIHNQKPLIVG